MKNADSILIDLKYVDGNYHLCFASLIDAITLMPDIENFRFFEGVQFSGNNIIISKNTIYDIDTDILESVAIFQYNKGLKIEKDGIPNQTEVHFHEIFMRNPAQALHPIIHGNILEDSGVYYLLTLEQAELLQKIKEYNSDPKRTNNRIDQFRMISDIKKLIHDNQVTPDDYYKKINPVLIKEIEVDITPISDDEIHVHPKLGGEASRYSDNFNKIFERGKGVRDFYPIDEEGSTTILIIDDTSKATLDNFKDKRIIKGKKRIQDVINDPEAEFPGAIYSKRIIGWGPLNFPAGDNKPSGLVWVEIDENGKGNEQVSIQLPSGDEISFSKDITRDDLDTLCKKKELDNEDSRFLREVLIQIQTLDSSIVGSQNNSVQVKTDDNFVLIKTNFADSDSYVEEPANILEMKYPVELPSIITKQDWELYDYQLHGLRWLQNIYLNRAYSTNSESIGVLLADDMGLGKTLQILSFLAWLKEKGELKRALLILPKTLINNWTTSKLFNCSDRGEMEKFFPDIFNPLAIRSNNDLRYVKDEYFDIVLISYDTVMSICKTKQMFDNTIGAIVWDVIITDESQKIKNHRTKRTVAVKSLNGHYKIACTATPVENSMDELWSICDWILPRKLGSLTEFRKKMTSFADNNEEVHQSMVQNLQGFFMRRTKEEVLAKRLPKKQILVYKIPATSIQKSTYELIQNQMSKKDILRYIQKLIGIMSHHSFRANEISDIHINEIEHDSNKFKWLRKILTEIKNLDEKVIIFTPSKWIQKVIKKFIYEIFDGHEAMIVNGETSGNLRLNDIQSITKRSGFGVLILSPEVAGYGLTITEVNHVIHFSRSWNPAKENQATDRAYRIGQKKDVTVYIPIVTWDTKEEILNSYNSNEDYYTDNKDIVEGSPEENLDCLIRRKGRLLKNFFSVAANITDKDIFDNIPHHESRNNLTFCALLDILDPSQFEAYCALFFEKQGYKTILTPQNGDYGIDVVVLNYDGNKPLLIQVNKTKNILKPHKVNEVIKGKKTYEDKLSSDCLLAVFTNSTVPKGPSIDQTIRDWNIEVFDWDILNKAYDKSPIQLYEIESRNIMRKDIINS